MNILTSVSDLPSKKNFRNRPVILHFIETNHEVLALNNFVQYRIDGKVDIYLKSKKFFNLVTQEWKIVEGDMIAEIEAVIGKKEAKKPFKKLHNMNFTQWLASTRN